MARQKTFRHHFKHFLKKGRVLVAAIAMFLETGSPARAATAEPNIESLKGHVQKLCSTSKPRNHRNLEALNEAADYIFKTWKEQGFAPEFQTFQAGGKTYKNVLITIGPTAGARLVIGAHYDVADEGPGADDNASGVAGLLELSRLLKNESSSLKKRVDLVAYTLEEPPYFATQSMGSAVHANKLKKDKVEVDLMISLEMIGYFTDKPKTQEFPVSALKALYPATGNFIGVVGDLKSPLMVRKIKKLIQDNSSVPVESINAPTSLVGVDFSDHRNYWDVGYPAVMLTDTAFLRNSNYHLMTDRPETLDYKKMSEVIKGVFAVAKEF